MVDASSTSSPPAKTKNPSTKTIDFKDFAKIDLRVAEVANAKHVDGADKLLKLTLKVGEEERSVFAGIKESYSDPSALVGKHVVCVFNLAPKKMRFGTSEGMVLAAGPGGKELFLISPDKGALRNGSKIMKNYSLYYYDSCGFCQRVLRTIDKLKLDVERRHIHNVPQHRKDLIDARGRQTVPVLRIDDGNKTTWMPESRDIITYLNSLN